MQKFKLHDFEIIQYGLLYECCFVVRNDDCPFKVVDSLSFKDKVVWLDGLSGEKKKLLWKQHLICSEIRENRRSTIIRN